jgi:hypothetical protein
VLFLPYFQPLGGLIAALAGALAVWENGLRAFYGF